ncbi:MAG: hypothetical protein CME62_13950 [Halobacteriovoraceae bacterium]|nr:hypothetical protein [Halobacteriovoraceae bacterium]
MKKTILSTTFLLLFLLASCASNSKVSTRTKEISLGSDDFVGLFFNIIEIDDSGDKQYVVSAAFSYEDKEKLEIVLEKEKPLFIAIDQEIVQLQPIPNKYKYVKKKTPQRGERLLHIQMNDYKITKTVLKKIANSSSTVVKIPASPHKNKGFDGVFRKDGMIQITEFIE